jgi:succinate dehydrogenase / fumarate reductase cytochrome b subunit
MRWLITFFTSSIGRKLIMSLTGLFLVLFLIIHLIGNFQLLYNDGGEAFNTYAYFMVHNPLIKVVSFGLYFFILLHAFQGVILWWKNRSAKTQRYAVTSTQQSTWTSRNMALLGILIFVFLCIHMGDFWFKMKFTDQLAQVTYAGVEHTVTDLYTRVSVAYQELWIVIVYVIGMIALFFHLKHGFASSFQTLGWNHSKYNGLIKALGLIYSVLVSLGFAMIPIIMYLNS